MSYTKINLRRTTLIPILLSFIPMHALLLNNTSVQNTSFNTTYNNVEQQLGSTPAQVLAHIGQSAGIHVGNNTSASIITTPSFWLNAFSNILQNKPMGTKNISLNSYDLYNDASIDAYEKQYLIKHIAPLLQISSLQNEVIITEIHNATSQTFGMYQDSTCIGTIEPGKNSIALYKSVLQKSGDIIVHAIDTKTKKPSTSYAPFHIVYVTGSELKTMLAEYDQSNTTETTEPSDADGYLCVTLENQDLEKANIANQYSFIQYVNCSSVTANSPLFVTISIHESLCIFQPPHEKNDGSFAIYSSIQNPKKAKCCIDTNAFPLSQKATKAVDYTYVKIFYPVMTTMSPFNKAAGIMHLPSSLLKSEYITAWMDFLNIVLNAPTYASILYTPAYIESLLSNQKHMLILHPESYNATTKPALITPGAPDTYVSGHTLGTNPLFSDHCTIDMSNIQSYMQLLRLYQEVEQVDNATDLNTHIAQGNNLIRSCSLADQIIFIQKYGPHILESILKKNNIQAIITNKSINFDAQLVAKAMKYKIPLLFWYVLFGSNKKILVDCVIHEAKKDDYDFTLSVPVNHVVAHVYNTLSKNSAPTKSSQPSYIRAMNTFMHNAIVPQETLQLNTYDLWKYVLNSCGVSITPTASKNFLLNSLKSHDFPQIVRFKNLVNLLLEKKYVDLPIKGKKQQIPFYTKDILRALCFSHDLFMNDNNTCFSIDSSTDTSKPSSRVDLNNKHFSTITFNITTQSKKTPQAAKLTPVQVKELNRYFSFNNYGLYIVPSIENNSLTLSISNISGLQTPTKIIDTLTVPFLKTVVKEPIVSIEIQYESETEIKSVSLQPDGFYIFGPLLSVRPKVI